MSKKNRYRDESPKAADPVLEEVDNSLVAPPTACPTVVSPQEVSDIELETVAESGPTVLGDEHTVAEPEPDEEPAGVETEPTVEERLPAGLVEIEQAKRDLSDDYHDAVQALADKRQHDDEYHQHVHALAEIAKVRNKLTGGWRAVD